MNTSTQNPANKINILTSRFNNSTWEENETYRRLHNLQGCIYGAPLQVSSKIQMMSSAYVIEMNNETNRIEGIGSIRIYPSFSEVKSVYTSNNYNRYVYSGKFHLDRDILVRYNEELVTIIETLVFTGKTHMKRGSGLTKMPDKFLKDKRCPSHINILQDIRKIFKNHYCESSDSLIIPSNNLKNDD